MLQEEELTGKKIMEYRSRTSKKEEVKIKIEGALRDEKMLKDKKLKNEVST